MRLSVSTALALAVVANLLPGCSKTASDQQEAARSRSGASTGQSAGGAATGQASEGSTDDRKAPARPSSK
jgi:hypothetical protein